MTRWLVTSLTVRLTCLLVSVCLLRLGCDMVLEVCCGCAVVVPVGSECCRRKCERQVWGLIDENEAEEHSRLALSQYCHKLIVTVRKLAARSLACWRKRAAALLSEVRELQPSKLKSRWSQLSDGSVAVSWSVSRGRGARMEEA